ncbi:MAG: lipopolysaccharide heptosyltransferase I [Bacteroidia bacterium]|nr:lipopolysaccharide heptosyltransferase I [Methylotenera sp.]
MLKLLIVKTSSLGDVIHNLPIIADILTHHPNIEIDWLIEASFADIPKMHPAVNHVIPIALRRWRKSLFSKKTWQEISHVKHQLASQHYDIVLDTQSLLKSAFITYFTNGNKHGFNKDSAREPLASIFYDIKHQVSRTQQAVALNRALAAKAFAYEMPNTLPVYGIQANTPVNISLNSPYIVGLHGTSRDSKLWPIAQWIDLGNLLAKQQRNLVLPWASEAELQRANQIANTLKNATVLPKLSIAELATIISKAEAAVGVDTGLSHLAAALNLPTIAIYTDTDPALTGVCAGAFAPAINLGGIDQLPTAAEAFQALTGMTKGFNQQV